MEDLRLESVPSGSDPSSVDRVFNNRGRDMKRSAYRFQTRRRLRNSESVEEVSVGSAEPEGLPKLEERLHRACEFAHTDRIEAEVLDPEEGGGIVALREAVDRFEETYLRKILIQCGCNVSRVASELGISRQTLYTKFKRHGIEPTLRGCPPD